MKWLRQAIPRGGAESVSAAGGFDGRGNAVAPQHGEAGVGERAQDRGHIDYRGCALNGGVEHTHLIGDGRPEGGETSRDARDIAPPVAPEQCELDAWSSARLHFVSALMRSVCRPFTRTIWFSSQVAAGTLLASTPPWKMMISRPPKGAVGAGSGEGTAGLALRRSAAAGRPSEGRQHDVLPRVMVSRYSPSRKSGATPPSSTSVNRGAPTGARFEWMEWWRPVNRAGEPADR